MAPGDWEEVAPTRGEMGAAEQEWQRLAALDPRNFPQDFSHENGNYSCRCRICGAGFIGHKRRTVCRMCSGASISAADLDAEEVRNVR